MDRRRGQRRTIAIVLALLALGVSWTDVPAASAGPSCSTAATGGARVVRQVQRALGVRRDGVLGPRTVRALRRFQRRRRLPVSGCVDPATRAALGLRARMPSGAAVAPSAEAPATPVTPAPAPSAALTAGTATRMVQAAAAEVGAPYAWGAAGPDRFDCSGLVVFAAATAGIALPRTSQEQYRTGVAVERAAILPGDIVFFDTDGPGATHVGIAVDATHAVSATSHGVRQHPTFDDYWGAHYLGARRVTASTGAALSTS